MKNKKLTNAIIIMIIISITGILAGCERETIQSAYHFLTESKPRMFFFGIGTVFAIVSIKMSYSHFKPEKRLTKIFFTVMWIIFLTSAILVSGAEKYFIDPWPTVGLCGTVFTFLVWVIIELITPEKTETW